MRLARGALVKTSAGTSCGKGATILATAILDENQAVTAPSPWPITLVLPPPSTVAIASSVDVNRAQRVTSRELPSVYFAVTASATDCPGDAAVSAGPSSIAASFFSPACGPGQPASIQAARRR